MMADLVGDHIGLGKLAAFASQSKLAERAFGACQRAKGRHCSIAIAWFVFSTNCDRFGANLLV
jgi:hypothetical protein